MSYNTKVNVLMWAAGIAFLALGFAIMVVTPTLVPGAATWGTGLGWTVSVPAAYEWAFLTSAIAGVAVWLTGWTVSAHLIGKYVN